MKALVSILTVLVATAAFAKPDLSTMSWAEILSNKSMTTHNDLIFNNGPGLGTTYKRSTSKDVCHDGAFIYGGTARVQVCSGSDNDENCMFRTVKLKTAFKTQYKTQVCQGSDNDDNCQWVTKVRVQTPNRNIAVYKKATSDNGSDSFIARKGYVIPFCAGLGQVDAN